MTISTPSQEIWVMAVEAAEITGYNPEYMGKLARRFRDVPEPERLIRVRKRGGRYEMWLPDLLNYMEKHGYGPHKITDL